MHSDPIRDLLQAPRINTEIEAFDADPAHDKVVVVRLRHRDERDRINHEVAAPPNR